MPQQPFVPLITIKLAARPPQVGYVEAALKTVEKDYTYKCHDVVAGRMFARLKLVVAPTLEGFAFASIAVGEAVPEAFVPAVAEAIGEIARAGPRAGFPVVATRVTLVDGAYHASGSSAEAFARAAQAGFCEALVEGGGMLEPIMRLEVLAPPDYRGGVAGDIVSRRGGVFNHAIRGDLLATTATVPLANLLGYTHELRGLTQGHGRHSMSFERYDPFPRSRANCRPPWRRPCAGRSFRRNAGNLVTATARPEPLRSVRDASAGTAAPIRGSSAFAHLWVNRWLEQGAARAKVG